MQSNPGRIFRILALITGADHRTAQNGNKFGRFILEDYSGKTEVSLFREDYLRLSPLLIQGTAVYITGFLKPRFNKEEFEFKISTVSLAESLKKSQTKQLLIEIHPKDVNPEMINFVYNNMRTYGGGSTSLRLILKEPRQNLRVSLDSGNNRFEMNDELIDFLEARPEWDIQVIGN
jgi:DNA polymerase-3 subunit alpha